jgi:hypothetical protein
MTDGGRRGDSKYRSAARHRACESARGPDADRHVKLLIQFAVEGSLSGADSQSAAHNAQFGSATHDRGRFSQGRPARRRPLGPPYA